MTTTTVEDRIAQYLFLNGAGSKRAAPYHAQNILKIVASEAGQKTYSVSVDTEDIDEGQWNDTLIVVAEDEEDAKAVATQYVSNLRFVTELLHVEAYLLSEGSRVVGRLINTDEE